MVLMWRTTNPAVLFAGRETLEASKKSDTTFNLFSQPTIEGVESLVRMLDNVFVHDCIVFATHGVLIEGQVLDCGPFVHSRYICWLSFPPTTAHAGDLRVGNDLRSYLRGP